MLKKRVIPVVLIDGYSVVKTIQFKERRNQGNPITVAKIYNSRNVDELILLDIDASKQNRSIDLFTVEAIAEECFMPLTVGGGVRTISDIRALLERGADKVLINSAAISNRKFITDAVEKFGAQCIVGGIDAVEVEDRFMVYSQGSELPLDAIRWAHEIEQLGVGEIFVTSVEKDGTMSSCNTNLIAQITHLIKVPVVYAGGVGSAKDCIAPLVMGCSGIGMSSIFHFTSYTPNSVKEELIKHGISVRS
jgi:cyclase